MKASGTVMNHEQIRQIIAPYWGKIPASDFDKPFFTLEREVAEKQDGITRKACIKEVVDSFYGASIHSNPRIQLKVFNETLKKWQTFLKSGELK